MRIAVVTPYGAEERLDSFAEFVMAEGLAKNGDDVRLFTYRIRTNPEYREDKTYHGMRVHRVSQRLGIAPRIFMLFLKWKPEVVVLYHVRSFLNWSAYCAARLVGARVIFHVVGFLHDPFVVEDRDNPLESIRPDIRLVRSVGGFLREIVKTGSIKQAWENYIYHMPLFRADARVTISDFEREKLRELAGLNAAVIPNGIPVERTPVERKPERPIPASYLFFIGQVKRRKGWDTALEAIAHLKNRGIVKELVFVTSSSPSELAHAEAMCKERGIEDQVYFFLSVSNEEKAWLYAHAEATLAPSRYEGFGLPVIESWLAGTPVLGTDIPVYQDFLVDGVTGLVSPKDDTIALAENILRLEDRDLRECIIAGGRNKMRDYSDTKLVERNIALIRDVV